MKRIIILFVLLIIVITISYVMVLVKRRSIEINIPNIKYMRFSYSTGNMMYSNVLYQIDYKDNNYTIIIKPNNVPDEDKKEIKLDNNVLNKVVNILNKYDVISWNNFKKYDKNVLDGNSFSFYLKTKDNNVIDASGYMKYPKNYSNVKSELDLLFNELYEKY